MERMEMILRTKYLMYSIGFTLTLLSCQPKSVFDLSQAGETPGIFYPENVSNNGLQWNNWFAKNGGEIYYTVNGSSGAYLVKQTFDGNKYGPVERLPFDTTAIYSDVFVNEEGDHLIFMSTLPHPSTGKTDFNLWESHLKGNHWGKPNLVSEATSGPGNESYPCLTTSGNLYFSTGDPGSRDLNLYVLKKDDKQPQKLPKPITTDKFEGDCFVDPHEQFLIFAGFEREENYGLSDLYISFREGDQWTEPKNLGSDVNSAGYDGSPYVTPDGKYLVFTSSRASLDQDKTFFNHYIMKFDADKHR